MTTLPTIEEFAPLVREHQAGLRAFVRALGADELWVDDLAQEAFIIAYRRFAEFDRSADFGRWLRGIARNLVANERRKTARHSRLLNASVSEALALRERENADAGAESALEQLAILRQCVEKLPGHQRELLRQRYSAGESASELARRLQRSAESVRQNLLRIRAQVRTCVERQLAGNPP